MGGKKFAALVLILLLTSLLIACKTVSALPPITGTTSTSSTTIPSNTSVTAQVVKVYVAPG